LDRLAAGGTKKPRFTLPHCLDWIIFSRCGRKKSKRPKPEEKPSGDKPAGQKQVEKTVPPQEPPTVTTRHMPEVATTTADSKAETVAAAGQTKVMEEKIDVELDFSMVKIEADDHHGSAPTDDDNSKTASGTAGSNSAAGAVKTQGGLEAAAAEAAEQNLKSVRQRQGSGSAARRRDMSPKSLSGKLGRRSFSVCSLIPLASFPCAEPVLCPRMV